LSSCQKNWSYDSPESWAEIDDKFKFCKIGYNQSPINIEDDFKDSDLKFFYEISEAEKTKQDYVTKITFDDKNYLLRGKKKYFLRAISFNHPSEHLVKGEPYSLEMQIYHKSEDEQKLFLSIFLEIGQENKNFSSLINFISSDEKIAKINLQKLVNQDDKIFFYDGSLTTPPCTEGVKRYVMKAPIKISKEQMNQIIKSAIFAKSNARPVQKFHPEKY